ncbi:MAG: zinc ribbon domain-containing protein [Eggerthellaceae bacterium]
MSELLSELWLPQIQVMFIIILILLIILYILSIIWVVRDAYARDTNWRKWGLIALIPFAGVIAYCLLRPPLLKIDRDEQELEVALKQRELMKYGECAQCGYPVEEDYLFCPSCHAQLKNSCPVCHRALDLTWDICPYCGQPIHNAHKPTTPPTRTYGAEHVQGDDDSLEKASVKRKKTLSE